jgi:hypothetical protein
MVKLWLLLLLLLLLCRFLSFSVIMVIVVVVVVVGVLLGKSGLFLSKVLFAPDISIVFSLQRCSVRKGKKGKCQVMTFISICISL